MTLLRRTFYLAFVFAAVSARALHAQSSVFNVTNTLDDGSLGSLRSAVSSATVSNSTVAWSSGSGGTIFLQSTLPIAGSTTLDVTGTPSSSTISGASMQLGGPVIFRTNTGLPWTINSSITEVAPGAGSLVKTGAGTLILNGANTYSGGSTLDAGVLTIGSSSSLGGGTITLDGGTLQAGTTVTLANPITVGGSSTLNAGGTSFTISGDISGSSGTTKSPTILTLANTGVSVGTFTVTGDNSGFLGNININGGIVNISTANALGSTSGAVISTVTFNGGALQAGANGLNLSNYFFLNNNNSYFDTNGDSTTISGVISGGGVLTVISTGTLVIGNVNTINTYTGNTNISNGAIVSISTDAALGNSPIVFMNLGTLQITGTSVTSDRTFLMGSQGGTIDTQGNNVLYTGLFEGGGSLTKIGTGTLLLTGANSYTGGTFLNQGTINIINGSALGSGVLTMNGSTMNGALLQTNGSFTLGVPITLGQTATGQIEFGTFDTEGSSTTLSGVITGGGTFVAASTGTIRLSNSNTYSGGTIINSGVLNIASDASLGSSTGTVTFNGGTLRFGMPTFIGGILTSSRTMILEGGGGTIDTNFSNLQLFGNIISSGTSVGFTKTGVGILTLFGANNYSGATTIAQDTLQMGASGAIPTTTALTVNSGATFDMGIDPGAGASFTQTIASYSGAGNLKMTFAAPGASAPLNVTGSVDLTLGHLVVGLAPQILAGGNIAGLTFDAITAGSFTVGISTANIISPALVGFTPSIPAGTLILTAGLIPFAQVPGLTKNQLAVGSAFEPLRANPTGDVKNVLGALYGLDAPGLGRALDQIGPGSLDAMSGLGMAGSSVESAALTQRMTVLARGGGSGISNYQLSQRSTAPGTLIASASEDVSDLISQSGGVGSPWGFFASPTATVGRLLESDSPSGTQPGYAFNSAGLTGGADYRYNDNFAAGVALGYLHGHASIYAPQSGTVDNNSSRLGVYGTAFTENARANLYVGGAVDTFSTNRGILIGSTINRTATASPSGSELNLDSSVTYDFHTLRWGTFSPFAGLAYDRLSIGSFSESGADSLDLNISPQTSQSMRSSLGLRYSERFKMDDWSTTPYASLGWRHEFLNQDRPIQAQLASGAGNVFTVNTGNYARDGALVGLGALGDFSDQWSGKVDWIGDFRARFFDNTFTATLRYKF